NLIHHIMFDYHLFLRSELPMLSEFTCRMKRNYGNEHPELFELHRLFHKLKHELEQHLFYEEELAFPLIADMKKRRTDESLRQAKQAVDRLEAEHLALSATLEEISRLFSNCEVENNSCGAMAEAYDRIGKLQARLREHIH